MRKRIAHSGKNARVIQKVLSEVNKVEVQKQLAQLRNSEVRYSELKYLHEIGKGGHGIVFAATYRNQIVAVKQLISSTSKYLSTSSVMKFIGEMQVRAEESRVVRGGRRISHHSMILSIYDDHSLFFRSIVF